MHSRAWRILLVVAALVMVAVAALAGYRGYREHIAWPDFPDVDTSQLSPGRAAVVHVLAQEYAAQSGMCKYSEGNDEPWCADFTSWVMRESGNPFSNPNSGHWRLRPLRMTPSGHLCHAKWPAAWHNWPLGA